MLLSLIITQKKKKKRIIRIKNENKIFIKDLTEGANEIDYEVMAILD